MKTQFTQNNTSLGIFSVLQYLTAAFLVISCDSFVEVPMPKSQLSNPDVFNNYASADAALTDIYSKMRDNGPLTGTAYGLSYQLGNYADELICYSTVGDPALPFFNNSLLASNTSISDIWNNSYSQIYAANSVIEGADKSTGLTEVQKNDLKGEALFIRSLLHFYLTSLFGDIPYITSTDYKTNNKAYKITPENIYNNITVDLELACTYLKPAYKSSERTRPNLYTAKALLARVYLYSGKWAEASNAASAVLNQSNTYELTPDLSHVFLKTSKETIWQFQSSETGRNTDEASSFIFLSGPPPSVALSAELISFFDTKDKRKNNWIKAINSGSDTWYCPFKYKERTNTSVSQEYSIVFRLAEQYLIRAEARAEQEDYIGALEDLNKVRTRAGLDAHQAVSKAQLLQFIVLERRLELFTEYGHRFFDLKRSGQINSALTPFKPGWNSTDKLFPIPQNELSINQNLRPQNSGY